MDQFATSISGYFKYSVCFSVSSHMQPQVSGHLLLAQQPTGHIHG
jgi:hypothetical protein